MQDYVIFYEFKAASVHISIHAVVNGIFDPKVVSPKAAHKLADATDLSKRDT